MKRTLASLALITAAAGAAPRPNVIFILADDLGYSDIGCYGGEIATPNLDGLARGGLRFSQFYNTARCWPTRASLVTGYYAQQVNRDAIPGVLKAGGRSVPPPWSVMLPALLKPAGYRSYHSGKWHIAGKTLDAGFDRSYTLDDHDRFFHPQRHTRDDVALPPVEPGGDYYATTAIADHAIECLKEHARDHTGRPFFHHVTFTAPHFPLHALPDDIAKYADRYAAGWNVLKTERGRRLIEIGLVRHAPPPMELELGPPYAFPEAIEQLGAGEINRPLPWERLTDAQRRFQATKMAVHAAMVDRMDVEIGRILDQIRSMGAWENTLVFFASDNGCSAEIMIRGDRHDPDAPPGSAASYLCIGPGFSSASNTPFRRHKTWVHEGGSSTPLIAHWPAGIRERGGLRHTPAHIIDIVPTVLELAGQAIPTERSGIPAPPMPGRSLTRVFERDGAPLHEAIWFCHDGHRAIRSGDWKIVSAKDEPWELYNLAADRGETDDRAARMPEKVKELEALWLSMAADFTEHAVRGAPPAAPPAKPEKTGRPKP